MQQSTLLLPGLKFIDPQFHVGVNVSVRRGIKWVLLGSEVDLVDSQNRCIVPNVPIQSQLFRFSDIPQYILDLQHGSEDRNWDTLKKTMEGIYPNFDPEEIVTVVRFEITEEQAKIEGMEKYVRS